MVDLKTKLGKIELKNPVITASGTFGNGREMSEVFDLGILGAVTTKAITLHPTEGNPYPRICETPSGIINTIGLQNGGVDKFIGDEASFLKSFDTVVIANVAGCSVEEYVDVCRKLQESGAADALEINISCPNVKAGGMAFGTRPDEAAKLTGAIKKEVSMPIIVKLTPNAGNIVSIAKAVEDAGADGLSLINTVLAMAIDPLTLKSRISSDFGGLSGPAIKPVALRMVYEVASQTNLPVIGMGGISNASDAVEFLAAGASAVSVGTATLVEPEATVSILRELEKKIGALGYHSAGQLTGSYKGVPE